MTTTFGKPPGVYWDANVNLLTDPNANFASSNIWQFSKANAISCQTPGWILYDFGSVMVVNQVITVLSQTPACSFKVELSQTGIFTGEQITVFSCGWSTTPGVNVYCPSGSQKYVIMFKPIQARFVRWTAGGTADPASYNFFLHFVVTAYQSPYICSSCPKLNFCPATVFNEIQNLKRK